MKCNMKFYEDLIFSLIDQKYSDITGKASDIIMQMNSLQPNTFDTMEDIHIAIQESSHISCILINCQYGTFPLIIPTNLVQVVYTHIRRNNKGIKIIAPT